MLHTAILVQPDFAIQIIKTACVLHNFVRRRDGYQFEDTLTNNLNDISVRGTGSLTQGQVVREMFADYFSSSEGSLAWQGSMI